MAGPKKAVGPRRVHRNTRLGNVLALMDDDDGALWQEIAWAYGRPDFTYKDFRGRIIRTLLRFDNGYSVECAEVNGQERWRLAHPAFWAVPGTRAKRRIDMSGLPDELAGRIKAVLG